jgi:NADH dehydrogenase FAD-containing subunit
MAAAFAQITLVDRNATHVWKPLLHEVAAGRMDADAHDLDYRHCALASFPVPAEAPSAASIARAARSRWTR